MHIIFARSILMALLLFFTFTANSASFKSSYLGRFEVLSDEQPELYHVFRDLDDPNTFRYAPDGLKLAEGPGASLSVVIARSLLFEDTAAASFTFVLESNISPDGLIKLKSVISEKFGVEKPRLGAMGGIKYRVYLYVVLPDISDEGYIVRRIDQGTRTLDTSIAATLRMDSIDVDSLNSLLVGDVGNLVVAYVQTLPVSYEIGLESAGDIPDDFLQMFSATESMPLVTIYQNELANSVQSDVPEVANRLKELGPSIFGSTPALDIENLSVEWVVNSDRLKSAASKPSEKYTFIANDLTKSTFRMPNICEKYPNSVIDADDMGVDC